MKKMFNNCSTDQMFILKEITSLKIHSLWYGYEENKKIARAYIQYQYSADTNAQFSVSMRPQIINIELFSIRISILMQYDNLFRPATLSFKKR